MPVFWLGLMGLLLFYAKLGWAAGPGGSTSPTTTWSTPVTGVILIDACIARRMGGVPQRASRTSSCRPRVLGYFSLAYISRMTRSFMLEQLRQEYVTTARVKGLAEARVIWRHALRNIAVPLVTVIALSYANLLEGSVLTETVFAWPGLGRYITNSLLNADMNAVLGGTIVVGAVFIGINLLSDLLYRAARPEGAMSRSCTRRQVARWLLTDAPRVARSGAPRPRLSHAGCAFRRQSAGDGRARHRRRSCCWSRSLAPLVATHDPLAQDLASRLQPPRRRALVRHRRARPRHLLSRIVYGARITLIIVAASSWSRSPRSVC